MRVAIASCAAYQQVQNQKGWQRIQERNPDLVLLLGDNIYMDQFLNAEDPERWPITRFIEEMQARYAELFAEAHFKALRNTGVPIHAIWDDHDFAWNGACGSLVPRETKEAAREIFLNFFPGAVNWPGIYYSFVREGVRFILTDGRYFREPSEKDATLLGADQEQWLKSEITTQPEDIVVVCSSSPLTQGGSRWSKYRTFHERFLGWCNNRKALFVAGDIHDNEFNPIGGVFEILSSGIARNPPIGGYKENFGIIEFSPDAVNVELIGRTGASVHTIDRYTWLET